MKQTKIAKPDYDFEIEKTTGVKIGSKQLFTTYVCILKCTHGRATILINSQNHEFMAGTNFMMIEMSLFKVIECSEDFQISICRFSVQFFNEIYSGLDMRVIEILKYSAPDLYPTQDMRSTDLLFHQLELLYENAEHSYRGKIAVNIATNYVLEIYEQIYRYVDNLTEKPSYWKSQTAESFWWLCTNEHTEHRNIEYYAEKLNITSRHLHNVIKASFQMTPKQVIDYVVTGTAKKLLLTTSLSNQQIADDMSFPDQATFGQFFKRNVGMSPSEFRSKYK